MWIQVLEINENGDFMPVEVIPAKDVRTGGIFQLRQVGVVRACVCVCVWLSPNVFFTDLIRNSKLSFTSE